MKKGQICTKCSGTGLVSFEQDNGICYKCEGRGYIGEMPENFNKAQKFPKEAIDIAKDWLKNALYTAELSGIPELKYFRMGDGSEAYTWMSNNNKSFKFHHNSFTQKYIGQAMQFSLVSNAFPLKGNVEFSEKCVSISTIQK